MDTATEDLTRRRHSIELLREACREAKLETMGWLFDKLKLTDDEVHMDENSLLLNACWNGHISAVQWVADNFKFTDADFKAYNTRALAIAVQNGHFELAKWLHKKYNFAPSDVRAGDNYIVLAAAKYGGKPEVVQWLLHTFDLQMDDIKSTDNATAIGGAFMSNNVEVAQCFIDKFKLTACNLNDFIVACQFSNLDTIRWAIERFGISEANFKENELILPTASLINKSTAVAGWLYEYFNVTAEQAKTILANDKFSAQYNRESVEWVHTHYKLTMTITELNEMD